MEGKDQKKKDRPVSAFKAGAVSLAFLIIGYQSALFVHRAAALRIIAHEDRPDTVYVPVPAADALPSDEGLPEAQLPGGQIPGAGLPERKRQERRPEARAVLRQYRRKVENFRFNPNTATLDELERLGFSEKQAESIINYRNKGGRFRRKSDFARSYVVPDSVFRRLEPYIDIPKTDINKADSAAFDALPGIGPWFAARMVKYREELGGYSCPEQLLNIWRFDEERFAGLRDLVFCGPSEAKPFWDWPAERLKDHPDVRSYGLARSICLYRDNNPRERWTAAGLLEAGVVTQDQALRLGRCERSKSAP